MPLIIPPENHKFHGLSYDTDTGIFCRNDKPIRVATDDGYLRIHFNYKKYRCHRLAFLIMGIEIPDDIEIDHINGNRSDNRFENLRMVPLRQNQHNRIEHRNGHLLGTTKCKNGWMARTSFGGKTKYLGTYETKEEASAMHMRSFRHIAGENHDQEIAGILSHIKPEAKGVTYSKKAGKYNAYIRINGKRKHLGYFMTEEEATTCYLEAKKENEHPRTN